MIYLGFGSTWLLRNFELINKARKLYTITGKILPTAAFTELKFLHEFSPHLPAVVKSSAYSGSAAARRGSPVRTDRRASAAPPLADRHATP